MKSFQIHVIEKICKKKPKKSLINNYFGINSWLTIIYEIYFSPPRGLDRVAVSSRHSTVDTVICQVSGNHEIWAVVSSGAVT